FVLWAAFPFPAGAARFFSGMAGALPRQALDELPDLGRAPGGRAGPELHWLREAPRANAFQPGRAPDRKDRGDRRIGLRIADDLPTAKEASCGDLFDHHHLSSCCG